MSTQITTAFVEQYSANIQHLAQQMDHRFAGKVRTETQKGKTRFFDQIGTSTVQKVTTRHGDTPRNDTPHQKRAVYLNDYVAADLIDKADEIRMLIDPKSAYAQSQAMAFARKKDQEIIDASVGTSYADTTGTGDGAVTAVTLPSSQKVAVNYVASGTAANSGLTLAKLIQAKSILGKNEYPSGSMLYLAVSQKQIDDLLLNVSQVSSTDYAAVKALQVGTVDNFMGLEFIRTELLALNSSTDVRTCFAYVRDGLVLSTGEDVKAAIEERADKNYSTQVYTRMSIGATRLQEKYVVEISCDESP
jgi:hypothetical protein